MTLVKTDKDDQIWLCISGDILSSNEPTYLCLSYNSPIGSSRGTLDDDLNIFDRILQIIVKFEEQSNNRCQFLICGDLNARTANLADFVEDDSVDHVDVLPDDYSIDTPMSRMSADTGTNQFDTCLLGLCKQSGLRIVNGRFGAESGKYTYLTDRGSSVVDYVLATQNLFDHIKCMKVYGPNILSDHCLISFGLSRVSQVRDENASIEENTSPLQ